MYGDNFAFHNKVTQKKSYEYEMVLIYKFTLNDFYLFERANVEEVFERKVLNNLNLILSITD
ncbi:MAG TPA: hypothetical protein EYP59_06960 [Thiotrichaceae bacterium]|nr:hypothetical protein [Thiotrichaceae bacterium]